MRTCPFYNCGKVISSELFSCRRHWYSLTEPERQRISAANRDFLAGRIDGELLRRVQQEVLGDRGNAYGEEAPPQVMAEEGRGG